MELYAEPGEILTCTRGHLLAVVGRRITKEMILARRHLYGFAHGTDPGRGGIMTARCGACGACWAVSDRSWFQELHFEHGGWRRMKSERLFSLADETAYAEGSHYDTFSSNYGEKVIAENIAVSSEGRGLYDIEWDDLYWDSPENDPMDDEGLDDVTDLIEEAIDINLDYFAS